MRRRRSPGRDDEGNGAGNGTWGGSASGERQGDEGGGYSVPYTLSKIAAGHLGKMMAGMLKEWDIRCNTIAPGLFDYGDRGEFFNRSCFIFSGFCFRVPTQDTFFAIILHVHGLTALSSISSRRPHLPILTSKRSSRPIRNHRRHSRPHPFPCEPSGGLCRWRDACFGWWWWNDGKGSLSGSCVLVVSVGIRDLG